MSSSSPEREITVPSLRPSRYDRVASLVISTLILTGTSVAVLGVLWLSTHREIPMTPIPVQPGGASGNSDESEPTVLDMPSLSELPQFAAAELELSTLLSPDSIAAASTIEVKGPSVDSPIPGDPRTIGPPPSPEVVPRWERWEIRYEASSLRRYARQLDFFGIELAAVGGKPKVDYASSFTKASPKTRSGKGSEEKRLYLTWRGGPLQKMDRALLEKAGIDVAGRLQLQFYPQNVEDMLARVEREHTEDGRIDKLRKTIFGVRSKEDGYEFFIIDQR